MENRKHKVLTLILNILFSLEIVRLILSGVVSIIKLLLKAISFSSSSSLYLFLYAFNIDVFVTSSVSVFFVFLLLFIRYALVFWVQGRDKEEFNIWDFLPIPKDLEKRKKFVIRFINVLFIFNLILSLSSAIYFFFDVFFVNPEEISRIEGEEARGWGMAAFLFAEYIFHILLIFLVRAFVIFLVKGKCKKMWENLKDFFTNIHFPKKRKVVTFLIVFTPVLGYLTYKAIKNDSIVASLLYFIYCFPPLLAIWRKLLLCSDSKRTPFKKVRSTLSLFFYLFLLCFMMFVKIKNFFKILIWIFSIAFSHFDHSYFEYEEEEEIEEKEKTEEKEEPVPKSE